MEQVQAEYLIYLEERVDRRVYRISIPSLSTSSIEKIESESKIDKYREA